jgi:hypothetical protein
MEKIQEQEPTTTGPLIDEPPSAIGATDSSSMIGDVRMGISGLSDPDPTVRTKAAYFLGRFGTPDDLIALHEASRRETSVFCKLEIVKAIVMLEQRFLVESSNGPLACAIE